MGGGGGGGALCPIFMPYSSLVQKKQKEIVCYQTQLLVLKYESFLDFIARLERLSKKSLIVAMQTTDSLTGLCNVY